MEIKELITYLLTPVAQVAIIIGLAEIIKRLGLETRWIPLIDLGLGIISGLGVYHIIMKFSIPESMLVGIALGLSACGLFSGVKNTIGNEIKEEVYDGD